MDKKGAVLTTLRPVILLIASAMMMHGCINTADAATFSYLYVLGDSMSDTGHGVQIGQWPVGGVQIGTNVTDSSDYYNQSEYSNGPIWPEQLMSMLGKAYQQGGNQAVGGAATYTYQADWDGRTITRPGVIDQINSLQLLDAKRSVFVIWFGHNDLWLSPPESLDQAADNALATIKSGVALLRRKGATRILVLGVYDMAAAPAFQWTPEQQSIMDAALLRFNTGLQLYAQRQTKQWEGKATIRYVDTYDLLNAVRASLPYPDGIGISDQQWICCRDWSAGNSYGYWDGIHPTTFEHGQLAQRLKAVIGRMK
jgi:phospholipase/lecithinase/hemolysin